MEKEKQQIPIFDLNFAAFQLMHGNNPSLIKQGSRIICMFEPNDEFYRLSALYHSNTKVSVLNFVASLRQIRAMVLALREGNSGNGKKAEKNECSFQQEVFDMIARETGNTNIIAVHQEILRFAGDLETGIFLSQLLYWCDKGAGGAEQFFYKTINDWRQEIFLSEYSIRVAIKKLVKMGLLEIKIKRANNFPTLHFRLKRQNLLDALFLCFQRNGTLKSKKRNCENAETLTEITYRDYSQKNNGRKSKFASSVPFSLFKKEYVKEDTEATDAIEYFLVTYKKHMGKEHPYLMPEKWQEVISTILECTDYRGQTHHLTSSDLEAMMERYFSIKFDGCDYSILHFNTDGVKSHRLFETGLCV